MSRAHRVGMPRSVALIDDFDGSPKLAGSLSPRLFGKRFRLCLQGSFDRLRQHRGGKPAAQSLEKAPS